MIDLYPSIDLRGGRVVRLLQGDFAQETVYGDDPVVVAKSYADAGAPWVHIVDLDAAKRTGSNRDLVVAVAAAVAVPVQAGGGVRDGSLLADGVARVVVGSAAVEDPPLVAVLALTHPGQIAVGLDHRDGEVRTHGWQDGSGLRVDDLIDRLSVPGVGAFVVTDIARDGVLEGLDLDGYRSLAARTPVPVIASGGVGSLDDLRALHDTGVAGVIVGKALYEGRFTIDEAVAAC
ncbi:MAG: phosphoribosylformimino-5-aminoimidazole carboxamide ribotide isomerase, partial [Acidimicrobiaceae bacterium]